MLGPFYSYGLIAAAAGLAGLLMMLLTAKRFALNRESVSWFGVLAVPLGLLAARLGYMLVCLNWYREHGMHLFFQFNQGGYILYGAMAGVILAGALTGKITRQPVGRVLDAAAAPAALMICACRMGESLVRLGYGAGIEEWFDPYLMNASSFEWSDPSILYRFPLACQPDGFWRFSIFFWEALAALVICLILLKIRPRTSGGHGTLMVLLYAACQILLESMREDAVLRWGFVKINQLLSALAIGAVLLICCLRLPREWKKPGWIAAGWALVLVCLGVVIALEFALEQKISFLEWMHMDLCYLVMSLACLGLVLTVLPFWKRAFPRAEGR